MTKPLLVLFLLLSLPIFAQSKDADYAINIHVSESRIGTDCGVMGGSTSCKSVQQLTVLINGGKYELESETFFPKGIVATGDYKGKLVKEEKKPTGEFNQTYELKFPDGSTRKFRVTGEME